MEIIVRIQWNTGDVIEDIQYPDQMTEEELGVAVHTAVTKGRRQYVVDTTRDWSPEDDENLQERGMTCGPSPDSNVAGSNTGTSCVW
jgi:hypothetical protein